LVEKALNEANKAGFNDKNTDGFADSFVTMTESTVTVAFVKTIANVKVSAELQDYAAKIKNGTEFVKSTKASAYSVETEAHKLIMDNLPAVAKADVGSAKDLRFKTVRVQNRFKANWLPGETVTTLYAAKQSGKLSSHLHVGAFAKDRLDNLMTVLNKSLKKEWILGLTKN